MIDIDLLYNSIRLKTRRNFAMWNPFLVFFPKKMVGIDVGTSSIKVVEVSHWGHGKTLENYAEIQSSLVYKGPASDAKTPANLLAGTVVSNAIKAMLDEANIKTKSVIFSIPDFSTFCTSFDIPPMPEKEIRDAIYYNASQYITLPITEVTLDWQIIPNAPGNTNLPIKVFLVAIPNQVIAEYQEMAKQAGLELNALEAEALGITRALIKNSKKTVCLMDIGVQSSTVNIIDNGFLKRSYSFNFYSNQLSRAVASALGVCDAEAEEIKKKEGLVSSRQALSETLHLLVDPLVAKLRSISAEFSQSEKKEIEEVYITGGTANLPGLKEYFQDQLGKKTSVPNCFSDLLYPPILDTTLRQMSPSFSVAVGAALSGLET